MFTKFGPFGFLQMFSADTGAGGGEVGGQQPAAAPEAPATPQGGPPAPTIENPLLRDGLYRETPAAAPDTAAAAAAAQAAIEKLNFGGREVEVVHPVMKDIHKDYSELNRTFTQTSQEKRLLEQQLQQSQQIIQLLQQQQPPVNAQPEAAAPTPEELEARKEAFMERFYEDPEALIQEYARKMVEGTIQKEVAPVIEPIKQQRTFQETFNTLTERYSDFRDTVPVMQEMLAKAPQLENLGMEAVYQLAKQLNPGVSSQGSAVPAEAGLPTPAAAEPNAGQPAADPSEALRAQLMNDPGFKEQIFKQMLLEKQQQQAGIPPVMGNQPGGTIPTMPENKPKSLSEGSKQLRSWLGIG